MENKQNLTQLIDSLSPGEQSMVEQFIEDLKGHRGERLSFRDALDEFKRKHSELLRLLAQ